MGLQQRATAADIILSEPSELTSTTMDEGTDFVSSTIVALANEGVPAGSAERLLGAIGSVLSGTIDALAVGSAASNGTANSSNASDVANSTANSGSNLGVNSTCLTRSNLSNGSLNGTGDASCPSSWQSAAQASAAARASKLMASTGTLADTVLGGLVGGEAPAAVSSAKVSLRAGKEDPCQMEGSPFAGAPTGGIPAGAFTLSSGTLCGTAPATGCGQSETSFIVTAYDNNVHAAADADGTALAAPVLSIVLKQCGAERKVSDTAAPIRLKIPLNLPVASMDLPSWCLF